MTEKHFFPTEDKLTTKYGITKEEYDAKYGKPLTSEEEFEASVRGMTKSEFDAKFGKVILNGTIKPSNYLFQIVVSEITIEDGVIVSCKPGPVRYAAQIKKHIDGRYFVVLCQDSNNTPNWPYPEGVIDDLVTTSLDVLKDKLKDLAEARLNGIGPEDDHALVATLKAAADLGLIENDPNWEAYLKMYIDDDDRNTY